MNDQPKCTFRDEPDTLSQILLIECAAVRIRRVAINREDKVIRSWSPYSAQGHVFASERRGGRSGFPSIWDAVENTGIGAGCGNTAQYQLSYDCASLMAPAVWVRTGNEWRKVGAA